MADFRTNDKVKAGFENSYQKFGSPSPRNVGPKNCQFSGGATTTSRLKRESLQSQTSYRQTEQMIYKLRMVPLHIPKFDEFCPQTEEFT